MKITGATATAHDTVCSNAQPEIDDLLNRFHHFGVELGLERIERLLENLGNPHTQIPIIHVAGSNGKGSVCAYLSSALTHAGLKVGRYTSPHLIDWCERICLNDRPIASLDLYQILQQVIAAIRPDQPSPTQFEVITAAAWLYFAQQQVDVAVVEVGLGGRLDATNVCDRPLVSIITSLSREHWQRLGPTVADIAREKAGILKADCPAIIGPIPPDAEAVVKQRLADLNCPTLWVQPSIDLGNGWAEYHPIPFHPALDSLNHSPKDSLKPLKPLKYFLPLPGAHQLTNSALAIAALQFLQQQGWSISDEAMGQGIAHTQWLGRLQWMNWGDRQLLIDGAHNPAGAAALRHYLDNTPRAATPVRFVMGMLSTKDHADVFKALLRPGDRLYLVPVPDHASADLNALATLAQEICPTLDHCCPYSDVLEALEAAFQQENSAPASTTILCGSLYLIGHFFRLSKPHTNLNDDRST